MEFRHICVPLIAALGSTEDSVITNGSYIAHRQICGLHKAGALCFLYCCLPCIVYVIRLHTVFKKKRTS